MSHASLPGGGVVLSCGHVNAGPSPPQSRLADRGSGGQVGYESSDYLQCWPSAKRGDEAPHGKMEMLPSLPRESLRRAEVT